MQFGLKMQLNTQKNQYWINDNGHQNDTQLVCVCVCVCVCVFMLYILNFDHIYL